MARTRSSTSRQTEGAAEGVVADAKNGSGQRKKGAKGAKRAKPSSELLSEGDLATLTNLGFSRDDVCKACKALGNLTSNDHNHHNIDSVADWLCQNLNDDNADSVEEIDGPILGGPRARVEVDADAVRSHLEQYVGNGANGANGMVMAVRSHHSRLVFGSDGPSSPPRGASGSGSPPVVLSVPPGLRNLGATCYLNSHLQCLAQNPGFVSALLGWAAGSGPGRGADGAGGGGDSFGRVMVEFRDVLGRMVAGSDRVICTSGFAEALELNVGVMQDPNEFWRQLCDRMSEWFGANGLGGSLTNLLNGTQQYITKCLVCRNESSSEDKFSDLKVPIDIEIVGDCVVDVQRCLDSYLQPNELTGDCQYECST